MDGDERVHRVLLQELLNRADLGLAGRGGAVPVAGVATDDVLALNVGGHVVVVPGVLEVTVRVDVAVEIVIAHDAVAIPVGAFLAEAGHSGVAAVGRGIHVGGAAVDGGDEAVAVNVGAGIVVGNAVAVLVQRVEGLAGLHDEGALVGVGVDDGDNIDDVVIEQTLDIFVAGAEGHPPCGVHGAGSAFALVAVDVGEHADTGLLLSGDVLVGDLEAPEAALLPGGTDGIEVGDVGIGLGHRGELRLELGVGVAVVPVDVKAVGDFFGRFGANLHGEELSLLAAGAGIVAAGGEPEHDDEGKAETENAL